MLRTKLPIYDTPELAAQWAEAYAVMERVGELGVPCAMGVGTRQVAFQAIRAMDARSVLDIGTYVGTSALNYALAVGEGGRVVTVDIRDANAEDSYWTRAGRGRSPRELLTMAGVADRVEFVTMDSEEYLRSTREKFDFVSIDGWHEAHAVRKDVKLSMERLNDDGLIFMDDVQPGGPPPEVDSIKGPWRALERLMLEGENIEVTLLSKALNGDTTAVAFLTRRWP